MMIISYAKKSIRYLKKNGWLATAKKIKRKLCANMGYEKWITKVEASYTYDEAFECRPLISVIVPVYNVKREQLSECIESVVNQIYDNWELCLADDCSTWPEVREVLESYRDNPKVKIAYREKNGHISACTNTALAMATGEYVAFLDCDDILSPNALYENAKLLNENPKLDFIYSDEDKVKANGKKRHMPHFKPDWSPDTLMSFNYTCHLSLYRRSIVEKIGGLREGFEGSQDYDFVLRFTEQTSEIGHVAKILYHWRERAESTSVTPEAKPYVLEAAKKSKEEALERRGLTADIEYVDSVYQYRVNYLPQGQPRVSIIIPSKDNYEVLKRCLDSVVEKTVGTSWDYEVILVDNGSSEENRKAYSQLIADIRQRIPSHSAEYIYEKMDFNFSHMCNIGAEAAKGEYLLFLNDDIEVLGGEWLQRMLGHAQLSHVGAVGAKLLYPNTTKIQHAGVISIHDGPVHAIGFMDDIAECYFYRNRLDYDYLAVTGACLMIAKSKYNEVDGFEENLAVAYNDVDLCFKLVEAGYYNVLRNDVVLYHHESLSRGNDMIDETKMARLQMEREKLYDRHPKFYRRDPFYNVNLTQKTQRFDCGIGEGLDN